MNSIAKKAIGSSIILGLPAIIFLGLTTNVLAQFIDVGPTVVIDGVVVEESADSVTVVTAGSDPVEFGRDNLTVVTGDDREVNIGDGVRATGFRQNGELTARVLQLSMNDNVGYGRPGDAAISLQGVVTAKSDNGFTIQTSNTTASYTVNDQTIFVPGSLDQLEIGQSVQVIGMDTGSNFSARVVLVSGGWN